ncbi:MAG: sensor histidine kinase [Anaerolineae bacterium]
MARLNREIRVLVVDDDPLVTELVHTQLDRLGYTVVGAAFSAADAVEMASQRKPDVVLMDLRMSDPQTGQERRMAGLEAARAIHKRRPVPIILLTAYESPELVRQAGDAGVVGYLVKPVRSTELDRAIAIGLARYDDLMRLQRLNTDLQERNAELDAFADAVVHDLKAPLTPIIGYAEVLADQGEEMAWGEVRRYLKIIADRGRKINSIIDELLLLTSVRKQDVQPQILDMGAVVEEACQRLSEMIRQFEAELHVPHQWPRAWGYAPWVEEVWVNYLSNALKYGGSPPYLELGAVRENIEERPMVRFWVRDNGPGLTAEECERLFMPFERLGQVRIPGYGLGLSIVQRIIRRLGGETGVDSSPNEGSTFYFTLPAVGTER